MATRANNRTASTFPLDRTLNEFIVDRQACPWQASVHA
jgi:hypothetical protein